MPDQTPSMPPCPVCKMAGDHKLSCPEREDGQVRFSTNLPPRAPSMPPLPPELDQLIERYGQICYEGYSATDEKAALVAAIAAHAQAVADERVREALADVAAKLRRAGADLPAPPIQGTIPSAIISGLSVALALVEIPIISLGTSKGST